MAMIRNRLDRELGDGQRELDRLKTKHRIDLDDARKELDSAKRKHRRDLNAMRKEMVALKNSDIQLASNIYAYVYFYVYLTFIVNHI